MDDGTIVFEQPHDENLISQRLQAKWAGVFWLNLLKNRDGGFCTAQG
jgi:hypothetical protein